MTMFSRKEKSDSAWPAVPPSLNHESYELQDSKRQNAIPAPPPDTAGEITPYLGLRARLSQAWINRWTVLLLLVLVRVLILTAGIWDDIGDAKAKALSACTKVEDIGSAMASMPHYLSVGVNNLASDGITKAVHAMVEILQMILTGVEALIIFVINMYVGTYICLTSALIHGGLDLGIGAADAASKAMNDGIQKGVEEINKAVGDVQNTINDAFNGIKNAGSVFGADINPPTLDISGSLDSLKNIKIDDKEFVQSLTSLNDSIPTYDDAEKFAKDAISIPFDLVKKALNESYGGYQFDRSVFPVAAKEGLSFCSNNDKLNNFFTGLYDMVARAKIAFIVVIIVLAIAAIPLMAWLDIRRYRKQQRHARVFTSHGYDPMDVVYIASRPLTATVGIKTASGFAGKRQLLVRWAVAYATSLPALFVLSLALAGFFSCLCQFILLRTMQNEAPALAHQVGDFAGEVVTTLESVSVKWANDANGVINHFSDEINNDVLGYVTNATTAVNDTLNTFTDEINKGIDKAFGGTVLDNTVKQIIRCLIGLKVEAVEKGLTWVHDNAKVSLPLFPNDTFSVGAQKSISGDSDLTSFLASPSSVTTDEISGAVEHVINYLHNSIIQEALISTGLILVYTIVVLIGVLRAIAGMVTPDRTRGDGGQRFYTGDGRAPPSPRQAGDDGGNSYASRHNDEKFAEVSSGRGQEKAGHWRSSSYGRVENVGR